MNELLQDFIDIEKDLITLESLTINYEILNALVNSVETYGWHESVIETLDYTGYFRNNNIFPDIDKLNDSVYLTGALENLKDKLKSMIRKMREICGKVADKMRNVLNKLSFNQYKVKTNFYSEVYKELQYSNTELAKAYSNMDKILKKIDNTAKSKDSEIWNRYKVNCCAGFIQADRDIKMFQLEYMTLVAKSHVVVIALSNVSDKLMKANNINEVLSYIKKVIAAIQELEKDTDFKIFDKFGYDEKTNEVSMVLNSKPNSFYNMFCKMKTFDLNTFRKGLSGQTPQSLLKESEELKKILKDDEQNFKDEQELLKVLVNELKKPQPETNNPDQQKAQLLGTKFTMMMMKFINILILAKSNIRKSNMNLHDAIVKMIKDTTGVGKKQKESKEEK